LGNIFYFTKNGDFIVYNHTSINVIPVYIPYIPLSIKVIPVYITYIPLYNDVIAVYINYNGLTLITKALQKVQGISLI
jgi:hypothetical protein